MTLRHDFVVALKICVALMLGGTRRVPGLQKLCATIECLQGMSIFTQHQVPVTLYTLSTQDNVHVNVCDEENTHLKYTHMRQ